MGSVAASEILNLETYNELNFLARQMYVLRPIPIIFKISKINVGLGFPTWGFRDPPPPPRGRVPGTQESETGKIWITVI